MSKTTRPSSPDQSPAEHYLDLIRKRIAAIRRDMPKLTALGEQMAGPLLAGGRFLVPPVARFWRSECTGRAGGLMGISHGHYRPRNANDVALFALPAPRRWAPAEDELLKSLLASKAKLFVNGRSDELAGVGPGRRFSGFTDGPATGAGLYGVGKYRPLCPVRHFDQFVRGWIATGEMVAACTRAGRMPILYMSVWLEGALVRNASFVRHDNLGEPWRDTPMFHEDRYVPPLAPGYVGGAFLEAVEALRGSLLSQTERLAKAGRWLAQAKRRGKGARVVAVGHSYPSILEVADEPRRGMRAADNVARPDYPLQWGWPCSNLRWAVPDSAGAGDVALHLGYSPVILEYVQEVLARGVRLIYTSPYGRPAALKGHKNLLWFDLPWRPGDATVDVPGYSVRLLPGSSAAHTMAYFAVLAEMADRMGWT